MKRSVRDLDVRGKRALVRADYNVPLDKEGRVVDATRIEATLPTIMLLRDGGASVVLMCTSGARRGGASPS